MISKTASSFHILDIKGKPLIAKYYRDDIPKNCIQDFVKNVIKSGEEKPPVFQNEDGFSFIYIKHNNIFSKYHNLHIHPVNGVLNDKSYHWYIFLINTVTNKVLKI